MRQRSKNKIVVRIAAGVLPLIFFAGAALASASAPAQPSIVATAVGGSVATGGSHSGWQPLTSWRTQLQRYRQAQVAQAAAQQASKAAAAQQAVDALAAQQRQAVAAQTAARASRAASPAAAPAAPRPPVSPGSNRATGQQMAASYGWVGQMWNCLDSLWGDYESGWNQYDTNRYSGAYGIPQALPAGKMASAGADWQTNPATQIAWGLGYIAGRYHDPCAALAHRLRYRWY